MKKNSRARFEKPKARKKKDPVSGFTSLNQVTGVSKPKPHHSSIPVAEPLKVSEPYPDCAYCGKKIDSIASAFKSADGGYVHFDCVLEALAETEHPTDKQKISYLGSGIFGVVEMNEEGKFVIVKRIPFETAESYKSMKEYVSGLKA